MLDIAAITKVGNRNINEDSIGYKERSNQGCFVLCDGLGGHGLGDVASRCVVDDILSNYEENGFDKKTFGMLFERAQKELLEEQAVRKATTKMKTTCVVLCIDGKDAHVGHVGDSRGYYFRRGKVKKRTLDHSIPQMLVKMKEIKESEIRNHPDRNTVLRVMGIPWDNKPYEFLRRIRMREKDAFLLCTDGFWELIEESDMERLFAESQNANEWIEKMEKIVIANGKDKKMDNYSAIAIWNV